MNETKQPDSNEGPSSNSTGTERTKRITIAGWLAGFTAFFAVTAVAGWPTWPATIGVSAVAAMVAFVCYLILKK